VSQTRSPSTGRVYGRQRTCQVLGIPRSTLYAVWARAQQAPARRKRGPKTAGTDPELTAQIREVLARSPFVGEGYRKVWARVLHLLREAGLLAPTRVGQPHSPKAHDGTIIPERPDGMWGSDATAS
jgi:hypothetical protein